MSKEKIKNKLIKYRMSYSESQKTLIVNLGLSQEIQIAFSEDNKVLITDRFTNWNPISGILKISLKNAMIIQSITIFLSWLFLLIIFSSFKFGVEYFEFITMVLVGSWGFAIFWSTYYLIKLENFKGILINWLDD